MNYNKTSQKNICKRQSNILFVIIISILAWQTKTSIASTRLGLHVTQEELKIWRQRAKTGPYKVTGDVSQNSPGDWTRILQNANDFLSHPSAERWEGQPKEACNGQNENKPTRGYGAKIRDAAFVYLITQDMTYRNAVLKELLAQARIPGTKFADRKRWCPDIVKDTWGVINESNPYVMRLVFAYDYIRSSVVGEQRTELDQWFLDAAHWYKLQPNRYAKQRWPNRDKDDYSSSPYSLKQNGILYYGGPKWFWWHNAWSNQPANGMRTVALIGIMLNNEELKENAKRYYKEWVRYNIWPDGTIGDQYRSTYQMEDISPCTGFHYAGQELSSMAEIADAFARIGDFELINYTTSEGYAGTEGGPKNLKKALRRLQSYVNHQIKVYGTVHKNNIGNEDWLIDSECNKSTGNSGYTYHSIEDIWTAPIVNIYFRDSKIKEIYMRTAPNSPPYPSKPFNTGHGAWNGDWGIYPAVLFLFGDMEGKVWPYPKPTSSPIPLAPTNLYIKRSEP